MIASLSFGKAIGSTSQRDVDIPKDFLLIIAKRHIIKEFSSPPSSGTDVLQLQDDAAGMIRFSFKDDSFRDDGILEIIDLNPERSRVRITLPLDYKDRSQVVLSNLLEEARQTFKEKQGIEFSFECPQVFASVKRHILKRFVKTEKTKKEIIQLEDPTIGLIKFIYRDDSFVDTHAYLEVTPQQEKRCRLVVMLPKDPLVRQAVFTDELVRAVQTDLKSVSQTPPSNLP